MSFNFTLTPAQPFDFKLTAAARTHFRGRYGTEAFENGKYHRTLMVSGRPVLVEAEAAVIAGMPAVQVRLHTGRSPAANRTVLDRSRDLIDGSMDHEDGPHVSEVVIERSRALVEGLLGIRDDLAPLEDLAFRDPHLKPLVTAFRGLRQTRTPTVFEGLVHSILGQQISWQVARVLRERLIATYGRHVELEGRVHYAFPEPEALAYADVGELRALGLSQSKAIAVNGIARRALDRGSPLEDIRALPPIAAYETLTSLRGVGDWTAQWLAVQTLGHPDAMPFGDLALRRGVAELLDLDRRPDAEEIRSLSERWSPLRSYVTIYLFAAMRSGRLKEILSAKR